MKKKDKFLQAWEAQPSLFPEELTSSSEERRVNRGLLREKREGLEGKSGLAKAFVELLGAMRPRWFVWENVPGCISSKDKRTGVFDFNFLLSAFAERGYTVCWRVLDAEFVRIHGYSHAVPQRRRRVFVVGHLGTEWEYPASVLFEPEVLPRNNPPRRKTRTAASGNSSGGAGTAGRPWDGSGVNPTLNQSSCQGTIGLSNQELFSQNANGLVMIEVGKGYYKQSAHGQTLEAHEDQHRRNLICSQYGDVAGTLEARHDSSACADRGQNVICVHGSQDPIINTETANPVQLNQGQENVICYGIGNGQLHEACRPEKEVSKTLDGMHDHGAVLCYDARGNGDGETANCITGDHGDRVTDYTPLVSEGRMFVRRLTPVECERLMGFPDNWTQIPWRGKPAEDCPDGPRYKACGNSMCVNVMRWIGMRIEQAERRTK